jgi:hypothetical protein
MRGNTVALSAFCVVIATTAVVSASASATTKSSKSSTASRSHIPKNGGMVNLTAYSDNRWADVRRRSHRRHRRLWPRRSHEHERVTAR